MGTPISDKTNEEYHDDESPIEVTVKDFFIAKTPVTAKQFCKFLNGTKRKKGEVNEIYLMEKIGPFTYSPIIRRYGRYVPVKGADDAPVNQVTWKGAMLYCQWLSERTGDKYRLPTEAEWEYAARGKEGRRWPWGNDEPDPTRGYRKIRKGKWWDRFPDVGRASVGSHPAGSTPEGVMDLLGFVIGEWCVNKYVAHPTVHDATNTQGDIDDLSSDRVVCGYYHRDHRSIGTWKGALVYRLRGTTHPGQLWTRRHDHPIQAPRQAALYGFRVVKEAP